MLKNSGLAALVTALALPALPAHAADAQRDWRNGGENQASQGKLRSSRATERSAQRAEARAQRSENRSARSAERRSEQYRQVERHQQDQRGLRAAIEARRAETAAPSDRTGGTQWQKLIRDRKLANERNRSRTYERDRDGNWRDGSRERTWDGDGNRYRNGRDTYRDGNRDRDYRHRDRDYRDRDHRYRDHNYHYRDHNYRQWDYRWRDNDRYDWYRYRNRNRNTFQLGLYYAPHRGYSYHRVSPGFYLDSPFYSSRYWIADPWRYRLPDAYGPYRWIRYYDDALLVDVHSGQVVDVTHDFFW